MILRKIAVVGMIMLIAGFSSCTNSADNAISDKPGVSRVSYEKPAVTNENGIFVDSVDGTNTASSGTMEQPLASLQWATDRALAQGKAVFVAGGAGRVYGPAWAKSEIYCGYNPSDWSFDPSNYQSIIGGGSYKKFAISVAAGANARLENCIIVGGDSTFTKTMGINNRGNTDLVANEIYGGGGTVASYGVITRAGVIDAVNNFIYGGTGGNATGWVAAAGESALVNNTIVSDSATNHSIGVNVWPNSQTVPLVNNIIDVSGSTATEAWALAVNSPAGVFMSNNNIYANTSGGDHLVNSYDGGHNYIDDTASIDLCGWTGCSGSQNTISVDPLFTGLGTINSYSPCYDAGIDPGLFGYSNPASTTDYLGQARSTCATWDIGRDEATEPCISYASADAYTDSTQASINWGSETYLAAISNLLVHMNSFIYFDPADWGGAGVSSAILHIYAEVPGAASSLYLRGINSSWDEMTITYNNQPTYKGAPIVEPVSTADWLAIDVTYILTNLPFNGISVWGEGSSLELVVMGSRESGYPAYLEITTTP